MTPEKSEQRTLDQQRAARAWSCAQHVVGDKEYYQLAKGANADIQIAGLGQTLAFWKAKGKPYHKRLYKDVSDWVIEQMKITDGQDLLPWIIQCASTDDYRRATAEAMAFLGWLKRFAEAELVE